MNFGILLAGGIGSRMQHAALPKQFLPLGTKPILVHTVERFLACDQLDEVYLAIHGDWIDYATALLHEHLGAADRVRVVAGGRDRNDTLFAAVRDIERRFGVSDDHLLVTHDAVRPFVTPRILQENIAVGRQYGAANTVIPAVDTLLTSRDGQTAGTVVPREGVYLVQTPQTFRMKTLLSLYMSLTDEQKAQLTDTASVYMACGVPVHLVRGEPTNLKITTPADYQLAQALVSTDETV